MTEPSTADECAVCLDLLLLGNGTRTLTCGHIFHRDCIAIALVNTASCPICREPVDTNANAGERGNGNSVRDPVIPVRPPGGEMLQSIHDLVQLVTMLTRVQNGQLQLLMESSPTFSEDHRRRRRDHRDHVPLSSTVSDIRVRDFPPYPQSRPPRFVTITITRQGPGPTYSQYRRWQRDQERGNYRGPSNNRPTSPPLPSRYPSTPMPRQPLVGPVSPPRRSSNGPMLSPRSPRCYAPSPSTSMPGRSQIHSPVHRCIHGHNCPYARFRSRSPQRDD